MRVFSLVFNILWLFVTVFSLIVNGFHILLLALLFANITLIIKDMELLSYD